MLPLRFLSERNGVLSSKPGILYKLLTVSFPTVEEESSRRRALDQWVEATRLFTLDEFPMEDTRFASFSEFRDSSQMLFEIPEIRRACFENQVAFNAINGEHCHMHSKVGIPLPVREQLEGANRVALQEVAEA